MRTGPRVALACLLLVLGLAAPAYAESTLNVYVLSNEVALGDSTTILAASKTDATYGGGRIDFKYKAASEQCGASYGADSGTDANGGVVSSVPAGAAETNVGGQQLQLGLGRWRICGWLTDDASGQVVSMGQTVVRVASYFGNLRVAWAKAAGVYQFLFTYGTSAPTRLYAALTQARRCPKNPAAKLPRGSIYLAPRNGRLVGSDGGLGREVSAKALKPGRWRVCGWLRNDLGRIGPAVRAFSVPAKK